MRLVEPASSQPRLKFDEDTLTELAESIKKIWRNSTDCSKEGRGSLSDYAGERRWRAAKAGWIEGYSSHYKKIMMNSRSQKIALIEKFTERRF